MPPEPMGSPWGIMHFSISEAATFSLYKRPKQVNCSALLLTSNSFKEWGRQRQGQDDTGHCIRCNKNTEFHDSVTSVVYCWLILQPLRMCLHILKARAESKAKLNQIKWDNACKESHAMLATHGGDGYYSYSYCHCDTTWRIGKGL